MVRKDHDYEKEKYLVSNIMYDQNRASVLHLSMVSVICF
jgi:hypothetical protein